MSLMDNYAETCRKHATNPEWPLELLKGIKGEFEKGMTVGYIDPDYILSKLEAITRHVKWCQHKANEQFAEECEPEPSNG